MSQVLDIRAVRKLPVSERLKLIEAIWGTIEEADDAPFSDAQWAEIQRKVARYERQPESALNYEQFKALVRSLS